MAKAAAKKTSAGSATEVSRLSAVAGVVVDSDTESARLLYDRIRLGIMSALSVNRKMSFAELKELLGTTDGNLSKHARRLEDAGFVSCKKDFAGRTPRTQYQLTAKGSRTFARHLQHMEALIEATRGE